MGRRDHARPHHVGALTGSLLGSFPQAMGPRPEPPSTGRHRVEFWREQSGYISHTPLGLSFNGGPWFSRQLQNRRLLTLAQERQEDDLAIRKF